MNLTLQRIRTTPLKQIASVGLVVQAMLGACLLISGSPADAGNDGSRTLAPAHFANGVRSQSAARDADPSLANLTVTNWRWFMSIPFAVGPTNDADGLNCSISQDGDVWFLGGPLGSNFTRTCHIPFGKKILSPIIDVLNDFPCPDPTFKPAPGQSMEAFLTDGARSVVDMATVAQAQFDGTPLRVQRVTSKLFGFTGAADLAPVFDSCVTGSPQLGVSDGFFVLIQPPSRGHHVLHIKSAHPWWGTSEGNYHLIVD
jgi:hypothetical protein